MSPSITEKVQALIPSLTAMRRDLHSFPELGWLEFRTASIAAKRMQELGFTLVMGEKAVDKRTMKHVPPSEAIAVAQQKAIAAGADPDIVAAMNGGCTGFWADLVCGPGPCFALRVDIDGTEMAESASPAHRPAREGFASRCPGLMHACGHDAHVAVGLAVAEILAGMKENLRGTFRLIFEPGEEESLGAAPMVAAGCLEGVSSIAGLHVGFQAAKKGDIVCGTQNFLAITGLDITYTGKSAHAGSAPHEGKNALLAACAAVSNILAIPRHGDGETRVNVGKIIAGQGRNVIPPNALLVMEARGHTTELASYVAEEAKRICHAAGAMWDCQCAITVTEETPGGQSSQSMARRVARLAATMPVFDNIIETSDFGASEDYTHMMSTVQKNGGEGVYIQVGVDRTAGHHNEHFDFDEEDLAPAVEILVRLAMDYL